MSSIITNLSKVYVKMTLLQGKTITLTMADYV